MSNAPTIEEFEDFLCSTTLRELESKLAPFNIFKALGVETRETVHSSMLAFLMDPTEAHGLGDRFTRSLLLEFVQESRQLGEPIHCSPIDVFEWNLDELVVRREVPAEGRDGVGFIDVYAECADVVVTIENKVDAAESRYQLGIYHEWVTGEHGRPQHEVGLPTLDRTAPRLLFFFLSPDGRAPRNRAGFVPVSYSSVMKVLDSMLAMYADRFGEDVRILIEHYYQTLRRNVLGQDEIQQLCARLWETHRPVLEQLMAHGSSFREHCLADIAEWAEQEETTLTLCNVSKSRVVLFPDAWKPFASSLGFSGAGSVPMLSLLCISSDQNGDRHKFALELQGPDSELKRAIWEEFGKGAASFRNRDDDYHRSWSRQLSSDWLSVAGTSDILRLQSLLREDSKNRRTILHQALDEGLRTVTPTIDAIASFLSRQTS